MAIRKMYRDSREQEGKNHPAVSFSLSAYTRDRTRRTMTSPVKTGRIEIFDVEKIDPVHHLDIVALNLVGLLP